MAKKKNVKDPENIPQEEKEEENKIDDSKEDETEDANDDATDAKKKRRKRKRKRANKDEDNEETAIGDAASGVNQATQEDDTALTIFVEGVPYDAKPEQVAECLVENTKISREDITDLRFPTWQDSGRMRGFGHVVFRTKDIHAKVVKVDQSGQKMFMGQRYLSIQAARPKGMGMANSSNMTGEAKEPSKTIMLKNLDYDAGEEEIQKVMEQFGSIADGGVRLARNYENNHSKGFAYVEYEDLESAKKAMERQLTKNPVYILKRAAFMDYDSGRVKGSFLTSDRRQWSREHKQSRT